MTRLRVKFLFMHNITRGLIIQLIYTKLQNEIYDFLRKSDVKFYARVVKNLEIIKITRLMNREIV